MTGVVMLVNEFSPLPIGGAETQAERLSTYLAAHNWNVWVITRRAKGLAKNEQRNGFHIIRPATWGIGKLKTITFLISAFITLFQMRRHYQILHAHLAFGPALLAVCLGRLLGKKVIVKLGGSNAIGDIQVSLNTWRGRLRIAAIRHWADVVIALTEVMQNEALEVGISSQQIKLMNNGIDANLYRFDQKTKHDAKVNLKVQNDITIIFIGRLDPVKSLKTAIDALKLSIATVPNIKLFIIGDGPERPNLEVQVQQHKLEEKVIFTGNQTNIKPYLQAADIFILPSITEGISNALLESMASGIACIASPVGGNNEVLDHGKFGYMPPVGDAKAWSDAFTELSKNHDMREKLGVTARNRVLSTYDFNVVGNGYIELYRTLIDKSHHS